MIDTDGSSAKENNRTITRERKDSQEKDFEQRRQPDVQATNAKS